MWRGLRPGGWSRRMSPGWWDDGDGVLIISKGAQVRLDVRLITGLILFSCFASIGSLSLKPPTEEIQNGYLCPDPVISQSSRLPSNIDSKVMSIRMQRASKSKDLTRFSPCTFVDKVGPMADDDNVDATVVRIRAINLNASPWNFTNSGECTKFIMFKAWAEYGNGYTMMCGKDSFDQYLGPFGHPEILFYHLKDHGMSFPLFHPNYGQNYRDQKDTSLDLKYMLIYYSLKKHGVWTCRVQQYRRDPYRQGCPSQYDRICGEYNCSELDTLYQKKMGAAQNGDHHQQRFIIVKSKTQEKYRVRNFIRQKFVPIVFLLVIIFAYKSYMKAGLRLNDPLPIPVSEMRLRRYQRQSSSHHHLRPYLSSSREHFRDIYFEYGGEHIPGLHIPYEPTPPGIPPVVVEPQNELQHCPSYVPGKHGTGDAPPSYESLFPPTYTEAMSPKSPKV